MFTARCLCLITLVLGTVRPCSADDKDAPSEEIKAILVTARNYLKGKKVEDRIKGVEMIGELGAKGKTARRDLCEAMLDKTSQKVRTAAADALEKVDKPMADMAVKIYINLDAKTVEAAAKLKEEGEPLAPLILSLATQVSTGALAKQIPMGTLKTCLRTLSEIAPNDTQVNRMVIEAITFANSDFLRAYKGDANDLQPIRHEAVVLVRDLKNAKLALKPLLIAAQTYRSNTRLEAIKSLVAIYDENNDKAINKCLSDMRLDSDEKVRKAVDAANEAIKAKDVRK